MFDPEIANTLPNGAQILDRKIKKNGDLIIYLAYWKGYGFPYVTWAANPNNPGATFWGNYFLNYDSARKNFLERVR